MPKVSGASWNRSRPMRAAALIRSRSPMDFVRAIAGGLNRAEDVSRNPRSTIGTMTDIYDFMRVLYATAGVAHCPYCYTEVPIKTPHQIAEHLLSLPAGTPVEICAPVFKIYGEDYAYLLAEIRNRGYRRMYVDDVACDISEDGAGRGAHLRAGGGDRQVRGQAPRRARWPARPALRYRASDRHVDPERAACGRGVCAVPDCRAFGKRTKNREPRTKNQR